MIMLALRTLCAGSALLCLAGVAAAAPVSPGNRPAYCRGEVSALYGVRPRYVKTLRPVTARNGAITIRGTVDKGTEGIKQFACRFDRRGNFLEVVAMTPDGE